MSDGSVPGMRPIKGSRVGLGTTAPLRITGLVNDSPDLAAVMVKARKAAGMTQAQASVRGYCTANDIAQYESGRPLSVATVLLYAGAIGARLHIALEPVAPRSTPAARAVGGRIETGEDLCAVLTKAREAAGLSPHETAERAGVARRTIENFERPYIAHTFRTVFRYVAAIGATLHVTFVFPNLTESGEGATLEVGSAGDAAARVRSLKEAVAAEILHWLDRSALSPWQASRVTGIGKASFTRLRRGNLGPFTLDALLIILVRIDPSASVNIRTDRF